MNDFTGVLKHNMKSRCLFKIFEWYPIKLLFIKKRIVADNFIMYLQERCAIKNQQHFIAAGGSSYIFILVDKVKLL
jgi:hypothetical protein